jgi:hypothetical protein
MRARIIRRDFDAENLAELQCAPFALQQKIFAPVTFTKSITRKAIALIRVQSTACAVDFSC